jgi:hypothetical protein
MLIDPRSVEGVKLRAWLEEHIEQKRQALERPRSDLPETQYIRGHLKAYRTLLGLLEGEEADERIG